jgi:hypothetical protein
MRSVDDWAEIRRLRRAERLHVLRGRTLGAFGEAL